jgi:hypothetical protein
MDHVAMLFTRFILYVALFSYWPLTTIAQSQEQLDVGSSPQDRNAFVIGAVVSRKADSVTVKNERSTAVIRINAQTEIKRVDSSPLRVGDEVAVRYRFDARGAAVANYIEANVDRWGGVIERVGKDTIYIRFSAPMTGHAKVTLDSHTEFAYCAGDDLKRLCTADDLTLGSHFETVGFATGKRDMRATRVLSIKRH